MDARRPPVPPAARSGYNSYPVRIVKTILTVLILAVVLAAGTIALFWDSLLTAEQKQQYGLHFAAKREFAARARQYPGNETVLRDYADSLVVTGNFGRALYLADLHGAQSEQLELVRPALVALAREEANGRVYAVTDDPALEPLRELPAFEVLRFREGFGHALLGDWHSAKNHFNACEAKLLPPQLRPYHAYYLARSYRLSGDLEEKARVEELLRGIISGDTDADLKDKARYNMVAWFLSTDYPEDDGARRAEKYLNSIEFAAAPWVAQKSYTEFAAYYLREGDYAQAWAGAQQALLLEPMNQAGKAAGELAISVLNAILDEAPPELVNTGGRAAGAA